LAKSFHTQQVGAVPCASPENTNTPAQSYLKPNFIDIETSSTRHARTSQFLKPGFIDPRCDEPVLQRETASRINTALVMPLGQRAVGAGLAPVRPLRPSWYNGTVSLDANVLPSSSGESAYDPDFVDSRKTMIVPAFEEFPHPQTTVKTANPPYARSRSTLAALTRQYMILLRVLLAEYRTTWFFHVFGGLLIPISFAFFIVALGAAGSSEKAIYLLGGNMALSIATGPASFLITRIGWARQSKEFHYWTALPVAKLLLVLAIVSVSLLFALPGLLGIYVFGSLLLGLPFSGASWVLLPLIPLGVLPLAGLGALLGLFAKSGEIANIFSNLLIVFVGILSPVMLPLDSLPVPLRIISQFMPTTYVADAFRAVLGGYQGTNIALDLIILALFSATLLTITYFRLEWRDA
jgi:ABC-2 type transport system permease protein